MSDIIKIKEEYLNKLKDNLDLNSVNQLKSELFGKNGIISNEFKKMGSISAEDRKKFSSDLNSIKNELHSLIEKRIQDIEINEINLKLQNEKVDVTLPERSFNRGKIHPVSQVIDEALLFSVISQEQLAQCMGQLLWLLHRPLSTALRPIHS